jgi:hypothetical protein
MSGGGRQTLIVSLRARRPHHKRAGTFWENAGNLWCARLARGWVQEGIQDISGNTADSADQLQMMSSHQ